MFCWLWMIVDCNVDIVAVIDFYTNSNIIGIDFVVSVCVQTLNKNSEKTGSVKTGCLKSVKSVLLSGKRVTDFHYCDWVFW